MKNEIGRVFTENGKRYSFDYQAFQSYVKNQQNNGESHKARLFRQFLKLLMCLKTL